MRRFAGCLGQLAARHRRVLVLRTGFGSRPASTRRRVALRLDVSAARVARIERHGLRALRALSRDGGCAAVATTTMVPTAAAAVTALDGKSQPPAASGADARAVLTDKVGSQSASGGALDGSGKGGGPVALLPFLRQGPSDWWYAVLGLGLLLFGWALYREYGPTVRA